MAEETQKPAPTEEAAAPAKAEKPAEPGKTIEDFKAVKPGMVVRVHQKIKEVSPEGKERERIQVFEGTIIAKKGKDAQSATITVRKISYGVGVEKIFPLRSPNVAKIEEVKQLKTRKAKLYFVRHYKKTLKEKKK